MAVTAILYPFPFFLGFESLPPYWELFQQLESCCASHQGGGDISVFNNLFIFLFPYPLRFCLFLISFLAFLSVFGLVHGRKCVIFFFWQGA